MIAWGARSRENIAQLCWQLQRVLDYYSDTAPRELDCTIIVGHRTESEQERAFASRASKKRWPDSMHNKQPSLAFDFVPAPFAGGRDWKDVARFARIAGAMQMAAEKCGFSLRWGGDWDQDGATIDEAFQDLGHLELKENEQ